MIRDHKIYEMQIALAAVGQLTDAELPEFEQHANTCTACRECIGEMAEMSRELFLMQATRMRSHGTPEGMQERFLERAARAGISVNRSPATPYDPRIVRVLVVALILAISASLSWQAFTFPDAQRKAAPKSSTAGFLPAFATKETPQTVGERAVQHVPTSKVQLRRRSAARYSAVSISPAHDTTERQTPFELNRQLFARHRSPVSFSDGSSFWSERLAASPLGVKLHAPIHPLFTDAQVAYCFEHQDSCTSKEWAFHLDSKLVSLSFLGSRQSINAESRMTDGTYSGPIFHFDTNRAR